MLLIIILVVVAVFVWISYNSLVKLRNMARAAWADIDVQLKRRHDLIPNLVETVKGYAAHERGTLEAVINARAKAVSAKTPEERIEGENMLTQALRGLLAVVENYPDLKANQNFLDLQKQLAEIEDAIQNARRYYNAVVRDYNIKTEVFPSNIIASMFGFKKMPYFEIEEAERQAPQVKF